MAYFKLKYSTADGSDYYYLVCFETIYESLVNFQDGANMQNCKNAEYEIIKKKLIGKGDLIKTQFLNIYYCDQRIMHSTYHSVDVSLRILRIDSKCFTSLSFYFCVKALCYLEGNYVPSHIIVQWILKMETGAHMYNLIHTKTAI